jgi:hypothetical protein
MLEAGAAALLEHETLEKAEFVALFDRFDRGGLAVAGS